MLAPVAGYRDSTGGSTKELKRGPMGRRLGLLLFLLCVCTSIALAQTGGTGALTGFVRDSSGGLISGAVVTLTSNQTGQIRTETTGSSGAYTFALLQPGTYKVQFKANGFKTLEVAAANVNVTETNELDGTLVVGSVTQSVEVSA